MKQSLVFRNKELFPGSEVLSRRAFKLLNTRDKCALLAIVCPIQIAIAVYARGYSALFQKKDCFECLLPHKIAS